MTALQIPTAAVFRPLLDPARYKGAYGGRGSGKSHFFGELMVEECLRVPGTLAVCIREVQKSLMQSSKRMIESKIQSLGVGSRFKILHDRIITPGDGLIIFQGMQDATAESIKSLEGFRIAWIEDFCSIQKVSGQPMTLSCTPGRARMDASHQGPAAGDRETQRHRCDALFKKFEQISLHKLLVYFLDFRDTLL
jgi:hypothetical protein